MAVVSMKALLETGVHFGHRTRRWNPKMKPYIFGARNGIYIIDLYKTKALLDQACETARQIAASKVFIDIDANARQAVAIDPKLVLDGEVPRLIDEWQIESAIWNHIRRIVDDRGLRFPAGRSGPGGRRSAARIRQPPRPPTAGGGRAHVGEARYCAATLAGGGAVGRASLAVEPGLRATLDVELTDLGTPESMHAELRLTGDDFGWVPALVPGIDDVGGTVTAEIMADGAPSAPTLRGTAVWRDGRLLVPAINAPLDAIEVTVEGGRVTLSCDTPGASLGWRTSDDEAWRVYTGPFARPDADIVEALAHRIGYAPAARTLDLR